MQLFQLRLCNYLFSNHLSCLRLRKCVSTVNHTLQEGDRALLRYKSKDLCLTKPLRSNGRTKTRCGDVSHNDLIGKQPRDIIITSKKVELRAHLPSLAEYVTMTPRLVTPIYPKYANSIVSQLDLHPSARIRSPGNRPTLEILEAGTGHGGLTLYLARAVHAANSFLEDAPHSADLTNGSHPAVKLSSPMAQSEPTSSLAVATFKFIRNIFKALRGSNNKVNRQAVIHTVDISPLHSEHAAGILKGFRRSMYAHDVEFYVGDVSEWVDEQICRRQKSGSLADGQAFLSHVILDLPGSHTHIERISSALQVNGSLLIFQPSITQIVACVEKIREKFLPLDLEQVLELGDTTGGREWDVRAVKPRAIIRAENQKKMETTGTEERNAVEEWCLSSEVKGSIDEQMVGDEAKASPKDDTGWEMVCRPKVGERVVGGGFVGVWKRMRHKRQWG